MAYLEYPWRLVAGKKFDHLKTFIAQNATSFLVLMEPMIPQSEVHCVAFKIGFLNWLHGLDFNSRTWIFWKPEWGVDLLYCTDQALTVRVRLSSSQIFLLHIYASCVKRIRHNLWDHFTAI